jgi:2-polyprenyl-6-methoxyphenol hydroxylase-like FAD-dependent oxidoreductase
VHARWLVGCDGAHSFVRHALDIPFRGGPRRNLQLWQLDAQPSWDRGVQPDGGHIVLGRGVSVSLYPMPGGTHRIFAFANDPNPEDDRPNTAQHMRALVAEAADAPELQLTPTEPLWLNRARFQDRTAARFRQGRVLLCGDAAAIWAPVGGHGMNVGLYGAENLARRLTAVVRDGTDAGVLDLYARQQRRLVRQVRWATRADMLEQPPGALRRALLETVMPPLLAWPTFNRAVDAALGDLRLGRATTGRPSLSRSAA